MFANEWAVTTTVAVVAASLAGLTDALRFKVYNVLTFPLALSGLIYHSWLHGMAGFAAAGTALATGLVVLIVPYCRGVLGAGDVKFFSALLAWVGMESMATILLGACLASGLYSAAIVVRSHGMSELWTKLRCACLFLFSFRRANGFHLGQSSVQEVLATSPEYRQRLVPFTAMIGVGLLVSVVREILGLS